MDLRDLPVDPVAFGRPAGEVTGPVHQARRLTQLAAATTAGWPGRWRLPTLTAQLLDDLAEDTEEP
jgi:hypothetical protein